MKKYNGKKIFLRLKIISIITFFILTSCTPIILAQSDNNISINEKNIIIQKNDNSGIEFILSFNDFNTQNIQENGQIYDRIKLLSCGYTIDYGKAEMPVMSYYIAMPQNAEVKLNYETSGFEVIEGFNIYPAQLPKPETDGYIDPEFIKDEEFYQKDEFYPQEVVQLSPTITLRGCRMALVMVFPFSYNPITKELRFYKDIDVDIDFIGGTGEYIPERLRSIYFQPFYDSYLINSNNVERAEKNNPHQNSGVINEDDRADLLIVVYDDFYEEILPLAEWRHLSGIETKVVKWSEIGTTSADLRAYVLNAYTSWELPPSFLLIVGDADHVPVNYLQIHPYHGEYTGTDLWYITTDGSDYFPDMHAGRISVEDEAQCTVVVNKILSYCKTPYMDEDWFSNVLLAAKEESGRYFVYTSERVYNYLNPLGYNCDRQYQGTSPPGSTAGVIAAIDNGVIIANHRDHGAAENDGYGYTGWSAPQFDTTHIANDIDNGEKYPVMFSLNCDSGWFDGETDSNGGNYESIGEVGLRVENKGFVAVVASTRVSYSGYNDELCCGFYDAMFSDFDPDYPTTGSTNPYTTEVYRVSQILNYGKFWMYDKYVEPGGCPPYPWTPNDEVSRTTFEIMHVHGDPTTEIWTAFPGNLDVTNTVNGDMLDITVTGAGNPIEGALVCISQEDGLYANGLTDETGSVSLDITGASEEDINMVVTAHNYLYHSEIVQANQAPVKPQVPSGPSSGAPGTSYLFSTTTTDDDGDRILYMWDWGDGTFSDWLGPFNSGVTATAFNSWVEKGSYEIKVKAKDTKDVESEWSEPIELRMPVLFNLLDILEIRFPILYTILSTILK